jgi:hypothetical protein
VRGSGVEKLALALFVAWVLANHAHDSLAANDAAGFTKRFYRGTNAHGMRK